MWVLGKGVKVVCGLVRVSVGGHSGVWVSIGVCGGS